MSFHHKKLANSVLVLLLSFTYPVYASRLYSDIPAGHWSENAADVLNEEHIMDGISSNEFGGNLPINRYDTAKIINGLMGNKSAGPGLILLSDVRSGNPYFTTIMKVLNANLMEVSNNKFSGDKKVSRYDFAKYIIATLNYLQAEAISIRQSPKAIGNVAADKRDIINKSVNYWQLTDGYNDWDQNINRYSALEMVARAAININPDLRSRIGDVVRTGVTPDPNKTPVPTIIPTTPVPTVAPTSIFTPTPTVRPTPEVTLAPTSIPTAISTPVTVPTPILSTPTPISVPTPILSTPVPTTLPTPILSNPTPISIPTPIISMPTPVVTPPPINTSSTNNQILRNQSTFRGMYNLLYSESLPVEFDKIDNLKKKDDNLGVSFSEEGSYWFKDYDIPFVKDMGLIVGINFLGSYGYPAETTVIKPDTEISETSKSNLSLMYKLYKSPDIELALGLDGYYRITSRNSTHIVDSYWRASKSYLGIGARGLVGWRVMDRLEIESSLFAHYVSQTINDKIVTGTTPQPVASGSPANTDGNALDRFDIEFDLNARYDIFQFGSNWIYANADFDGRFLLGDGNQTIVGVGAGIGISY